jgi:hypothetical protein
MAAEAEVVATYRCWHRSSRGSSSSRTGAAVVVSGRGRTTDAEAEVVQTYRGAAAVVCVWGTTDALQASSRPVFTDQAVLFCSSDASASPTALSAPVSCGSLHRHRWHYMRTSATHMISRSRAGRTTSRRT